VSDGGPDGAKTDGHRFLHLTPAAVWESQAAADHYTPEAYLSDGFIHFTIGEKELLAVGNRYYADDRREYVAVEDDNVAAVPDNVPLAEASIASCAIGTCLNGIRDVGRVQMGESVLVTGAGGGLGMHAVQLARRAGALVIAQTTSPDKAERIRALGAHHVVVHARGEDFSPEVKRLSGGGVDVLVDNVGTPLFEPMRRSLGIAGRWILIGQLTGQFIPFNPAQLFLKNQSMLSVTSTSRNQLEDTLALMSRGEVKAIVTQTLPLEEAAQAHRLVEAGRAAGRIVLKP
jgi:NADPH:quinone reductase-like Zn-dependent oxidoreductase